MARYVSSKALCPHYKSESRGQVVCEGVCEDSVTHIAFATSTGSYQFKRKYCRDNYRECPVARMLEGNANG